MKGRPQKPVDARMVKDAIAHGNTVDDAAKILGVSKDTLERRFSAEIELGRAEMRSSLRKKQYEMAIAGNVGMLVWLGKNLLGQAEKVEHTGRDGGPIQTLDLSRLSDRELEDLERLASKAGGRVHAAKPGSN